LSDKEKDLSLEAETAAEQVEVEGDIESLKRALREEKEKAERYLASWQLAQADYMNLKRRTEQERMEQANFANAALIAELLPIIDDLERALKNAPEELAELPWVEGVELIYRKLQTVLEAQGLSAIEAEGRDFDPNLHDAVMCVEGEEGKVIAEVRRGYKFRNRVIRPAMVKVGKEGSGEEIRNTNL